MSMMASTTAERQGNHSIAARKERWRRFLEPNASPGFMFYVNCPEFELPSRPPLWPERMKERYEWSLRSYELQQRRAERIPDDAVPHLACDTGTEIFAEALGCRVERPTDNTPFAIPFIHTAAEAEKVRVPALDSSTLAPLFDLADKLCQHAGPDAVLKMVDIQSSMDIVALLWDKTELFVAMVDEPEAVKSLSARVWTLLTAFLDEWFRRFGIEYIAHYPNYFMSGGVTLSEDEIGAVSNGMFREFFLPELASLSQRYGGLGMHCCADARHQWDNFLAIPGLRLLNLVNPPTRTLEAYTKTAYHFFARHTAQYHMGWVPSGDIATWPAQFPRDSRVVLQVEASNCEEAIRKCNILNEIRSDFLSS